MTVDDKLHGALHLVANMVADMERHKEKICKFMDQWVEEDRARESKDLQKGTGDHGNNQISPQS